MERKRTKDSGIVKRIEEQINQMRNRPVIEIERKEKKKKIKLYSLADLMEMEDEE